jgi:DNA-binding transcriptional MerR regulator
MDLAKPPEAPFAVGAVARLTGLSAHVLRSWERRYSAVRPQRTPGGSRRYTEADVARLRLLRAAVGEGHPISALAPLSDAAIAELLDTRSDSSEFPFEAVVGAIARLDAREVERLFEFQLFARGPRGFARDFVLPLFVEVGARWETGRLSIAADRKPSRRSAARGAGGGRSASHPVHHARGRAARIRRSRRRVGRFERGRGCDLSRG